MAEFDVGAARKAGYSDDDILKHLTETRKFDVDGAVKSGYSKADIITHLSTTAPQEEKSLGGFASNVLTSGANFVGDLAHAVVHPVDTLTGMGKVITGGLGKGMEALGAPKPLEERPHHGPDGQIVPGKSVTPEFDGLLKHVTDRYGSFDKVKETMYQDPVGFLADLSTFAGGAGAAADAAKLGKVAKVAETVSRFTDPIRGPVAAVSAIPGVKAGVTAAADATKSALNKGALRGGFQVNTDAAKVADATQAMGEHAVPFSKQGIEKVNQAIRDLQLQKEAAVGGTPRTIDPAAVERRLDAVASDKAWQVNPSKDVKQVEDVRKAFRERVGTTPPMAEPVPVTPMARDASQYESLADYQPRENPLAPKRPPVRIPADEAEALKEGTYRNNQYDRTPASAQATADAEKALARGLKEELETQIPQLKGLNAAQAKLINLDDILSKAVTKYTNTGEFWGNLKKNLGSKAGLSVQALGDSAAIAGHNPVYAAAGGAAQVMMAVLADPAVKARLATAIDTAQRAKPGTLGKVAATVTGASRVQSYLDSLSPKEN